MFASFVEDLFDLMQHLQFDLNPLVIDRYEDCQKVFPLLIGQIYIQSSRLLRYLFHSDWIRDILIGLQVFLCVYLVARLVVLSRTYIGSNFDYTSKIPPTSLYTIR